jgi:RimJ/RimL family protein N-acetyltransferase
MQAFSNLPIRTQRLLLRPLRDGDVDRLFQIHSDPRVMRYWSTSAWQTPEPARAMVAKDLASATKEYLRLGIESTATGELLGTCTLFGINAQCRRAEIGYVLALPAWGQGYMSEALSGLIDYAFSELNLNRIEADIDPRNESSGRVLERLRFLREGYLRERWIVGEEVSDTVLYGLLQREWNG